MGLGNDLKSWWICDNSELDEAGSLDVSYAYQAQKCLGDLIFAFYENLTVFRREMVDQSHDDKLDNDRGGRPEDLKITTDAITDKTVFLCADDRRKWLCGI